MHVDPDDVWGALLGAILFGGWSLLAVKTGKFRVRRPITRSEHPIAFRWGVRIFALVSLIFAAWAIAAMANIKH